jgi:hypothetical protein
MSRVPAALLTLLLLTPAAIRAEFRQVDVNIFGMD